MNNETKMNVRAEDTTEALAEAIRAFMRENLVGITGEREENAFAFRLVGGRTFLIEVTETK